MDGYHLTVLHGHASSQGIGQSVLENGRMASMLPFKGGCEYLRTTPHLSHSTGDFNKILDELVYIEKKHWTKSQSWGDQFRRLTVQKQNAYIFVLLSTDVQVESAEPTENGTKEVVAYCVMYVHSLHGQLSKLWVREKERNKGCATFLVSYAIEYIREVVKKRKGGYSILLFVETENSPAIKVYAEKLGFSIEEPMLLDYYHRGSHAFRMRLEIS